MALNKGNEEGNRQKVVIVAGSTSGIGYATSLIKNNADCMETRCRLHQ